MAFKSPNGLQKLKFVESTVFEIIGGSARPPPPPLIEGVGTKYLCRRGVNISKQSVVIASIFS